MPIKSFRELKVWQKAHASALDVYKVTKDFPTEEKYGVVSQMRRSAVSVCANIAEGSQKGTKDYLRYLEIARASLEETKYYLLLSKDLGYLLESEYSRLDIAYDETGKMLFGLLRSLRM